MPNGYVALGLLGQGGMGDVWLARDEAMSRDVAVKILSVACATDPDIVRRFENESLTMASLDHPAVVTVHARGHLEDGRPWYAMRLVRGDTLRECFGRPNPTLRRLLGLVGAVAHAVAYAHRQGIVHCDVKPENVLLGPFGEIQVLDWGISQPVGPVERVGLGTPSYMAPEQRAGGEVDGRTDVYALGRVLEETLACCGTDVLSDLVARARHPRAESRPDALSFARDIETWLNGEAARSHGRSLLQAAEVLRHEVERLEAQGGELRDQADAELRALPPEARPPDKYAAWAHYDEATACEEEAETVRTRWLRLVYAALQAAPDLPEAHRALADYHHARTCEAEARADSLAAIRHRRLLEVHDRGHYAPFLSGRATLTLRTEPAGIPVSLSRFEVQHRRLQPVFVGRLGPTPLEGVDIPAGSLLLTLHPPGRDPLDVPVFVESGAHWETRAPGASATWVHRLPDATALERACWMPAGWFVSGGDPDAADGIRRRRLFVGDRLMQEYVVTVEQYLAFLNDLVDQGREREAWELAPALTGKDEVRYTVRQVNGRFVPEGMTGDPHWEIDVPVTLVPWTAAVAYAAWWSEKTGETWRLPHDQECEKAARGVDGRFLPWGTHFEPAWTRVRASAGHPPRRASIYDHPDDRSVYGVRGVAGNVRVWCINAYEPVGPDDGTAIEVGPPDDAPVRMARGGSWLSEGRLSRAASRFGGDRHARWTGVGIRLIRELPP